MLTAPVISEFKLQQTVCHQTDGLFFIYDTEQTLVLRYGRFLF